MDKNFKVIFVLKGRLNKGQLDVTWRIGILHLHTNFLTPLSIHYTNVRTTYITHSYFTLIICHTHITPETYSDELSIFWYIQLKFIGMISVVYYNVPVDNGLHYTNSLCRSISLFRAGECDSLHYYWYFIIYCSIAWLINYNCFTFVKFHVCSIQVFSSCRLDL